MISRHRAFRTRTLFGDLSGLASALVALQMMETGARLYGAASSLREELGLGFQDEAEERRWDNSVAEAKDALGEKAFAAAFELGEAMTPEDAVSLALAVPIADEVGSAPA